MLTRDPSGDVRIISRDVIRSPDHYRSTQLGSHISGGDRRKAVDRQSDPMQQAIEGLEAWQHGDVDAIAGLLAPDVELLWWKPGTWDCHGKDQVLALLRDRSPEDTGGASIQRVRDDVVVVSRDTMKLEGPAAGYSPATVVRFAGGKVVLMRQFRSLKEALASVS